MEAGCDCEVVGMEYWIQSSADEIEADV
ncbi:hypothetical protein A2U01_0116128, partial [Trifolium medium]|nr:hypothetical protein [Trifolium medium]